MQLKRKNLMKLNVFQKRLTMAIKQSAELLQFR